MEPVKAVYALFADPDSAQRAVQSLRDAGVADRDITVISSEPFEEYEFSHRDKATWIYWIAGAGGALGLAFGFWLTTMTQRAWPLQTGGMPIVAMWPNLVVIFELTMLFAIVATVASLLVTAGLPRRRPALYDPEVSDGRILVGLQDPRLPLETIDRALAWRGGITLKTIP
ncbi:MAG: quinol:electron acceptor oxidoreductase subunit ActD [Acidobacteriota bacterium]